MDRSKVKMILLQDDKYVWWPHGYGQQPLWNLSCEVRPPLSEPLDEFSFMQVKTGFRTVEVVQDNPLEALKLSIKVNDVPIFARGATWIISHMLPELASDPKTIRKLLQSAKDANMNMLRVWGGGTYESDLFYEVRRKKTSFIRAYHHISIFLLIFRLQMNLEF